jgi:hypothetical protein
MCYNSRSFQTFNSDEATAKKTAAPKRMEANIDSVLPRELLGEVLQRLATRDLKSAVLVGRRWREQGEEPGLWAAWLRRRVIHPGNIHSAVEMLGSRRFRHLRELEVTSLSTS